MLSRFDSTHLVMNGTAQMTTELLPAVEVEPAATATRSVVWLHGLGADGHDFEPVLKMLRLEAPVEASTRFVFPHAPSIPVTINGGFVMPAWYDIRAMDLKREHDDAGVRRSADQVTALIAREVERGVPTESIVLAGFSQGGAMALHTALRLEQTLAGVIGLSCYLVCEDSLEAEAAPANQKTPIFQAHGTADPTVPIAGGEHARDTLTSLGYAVTWNTYPMQHEVCVEELRDIGAFLNQRLDQPAKPTS